jgi:flagellum-specific peptidoglycan hydrolase FlgJ
VQQIDALSTKVWQQLVSFYRTNSGVSLELRVATLAQCIVESGRGTSDLARLHLNFAGLKFRKRMEDYATPVDYTGSDGEGAVYCKFSSVAAFVNGYWRFIESGPYTGWEQYSNNPAGYIRFIAANFATDPEYANNVQARFEEARHLLDGEPIAGRRHGT